MKKIQIFVIMAALMLMAAFPASAEEEKREIQGINRVSLAIPADMMVSQGNSEELILIGSKDDLEKIETKVSDGHLKIYKKNGVSNLSGDIKIKLTVKELNELAIAGSGDVKFVTGLSTEKLELSISGSGDIQCEKLNASELEISVAGSGDVLLGGELKEELEISIAGSGDVDASALKCPEVEVSIAGSGDARVWAEEKLESSIVGSGNVYYKGRPLVDAEATGSGSTKPL